MAIHHKAPEQHYTTLMACSGLPYDINPLPHSTDFICKVVGGGYLPIYLCSCIKTQTQRLLSMRYRRSDARPGLECAKKRITRSSCRALTYHCLEFNYPKYLVQHVYHKRIGRVIKESYWCGTGVIIKPGKMPLYN